VDWTRHHVFVHVGVGYSNVSNFQTFLIQNLMSELLIVQNAPANFQIIDSRRAVLKRKTFPISVGVTRTLYQTRWAMVAIFFVASFSVSVPSLAQDEVNSVGFRMLEYPFSPNFDVNGNGRLPNINPDHFSSPSLTVQLNAVQATVAHCVAGNPIPDDIRAEIVRLLSLESPPAILRATVSAAIHLELKEAASQLLQIAEQDTTLAMQIEPALAEWKSPSAHEYWLRRLGPEIKMDTQIHAMQGLSSFKDPKDQPVFEQVLRSSTHAPLRLAAAQSLGAARDSGLEELARQRMQMPDESGHGMGDLEAASLVENHQSPEAITILKELCQSSNHSAANIAFRALAKIKFAEQPELALEGVKHADPNIRKTCVQFLADLQAAEHFSIIADTMADPIPENRQLATQLLALLAKKETLNTPVVQETTRILSDTSWQAREQAIRLACELKIRDSIPRFFELAEDPSRDVYVTAAWGLRKLVQSPGDLQRILDMATTLADNTKRGDNKIPTTVDDYHRIAHLLELLGEQKFEPAAGFLERFIPKDSAYHSVARATAIWSLGSIFDGIPTAPCRAKIEERMMDFRGQNPENVFVRFNATVAIGRIGDESAIPLLEQIPEPSLTPTGQARDWAIKNIRDRSSK
jgi:HEAT repeat protein